MKNKIHINPENEEFGDFFELESGLVSWTNDKICQEDLEFISVHFILARIKELETELNNEDSIYSEASCRFRIDELKNLIK